MDFPSLANAVRFLSIDAVQKANSGHPGAPMGMADMATVLWREFLTHNPTNPHWPNRDRFVLSNGHASMLLYSLLHLTGYDLPLAELKNFRQMGSKTPGHPEHDYTPGIETTTGPLGQGIANAVGLALAEKLMAAHFNRDGFQIVDHWTYTFLGDGCLMEGISHEVCSLAGTLGLGKLVAFYDDNGISIDGPVDDWFTDDTPKRFEAYGWNVIRNVNGHDPEELRKAIATARNGTEQPTLICCRTQIGKGSPNKAGSHEVHGAPLGADEIASTRKALNWDYPAFEIPQEIYNDWDAREKGQQLEASWQALFNSYQAQYPELAKEFSRRTHGELPEHWAADASAQLAALAADTKAIATRSASQKALNAFGPLLPELLGGSADLTPSNNTFWQGSKAISTEDMNGNYIRYGVREFGMSAIMNGLALYGGFIPYGGTFLVFSDYARNAVRMSALMKQRVIYVFTHDSIGLGEDGPTHQPVEHVHSLRLIPNLYVWRSADTLETAYAWKYSLERKDAPAALALTRQNLPVQPRSAETQANITKGGYVLFDSANPDLILIASGSEVALAMDAAKELSNQGHAVRVVSMPCMDLFDEQSASYKESVLPSSIAYRIAIEAGVTSGWYKYVGLKGKVIGLDCFGESAPADLLFKHFGFTVENVVNTAKQMLGK